MSSDGAAPADDSMPVLAELRCRLAVTRPLAGCRVAAALNVTGESVALVRTLVSAGAEVLVTSSKPTTFDADAAAAITGCAALEAEPPVPGSASGDRTRAFRPDLVIDNGDLGALLGAAGPGPAGGTVHSQNALGRVLADPPGFGLYGVTRSVLKSTVETAHGTGQVVVDALRAAGVLLSGAAVLVVGFGVTGRAVADYLRGSHARVSVTDIAPVALLRAAYLGYRVVPPDVGLAESALVVTATDDEGTLGLRELRLLPDGAVVGGLGHSRAEIDRDGLAAAAESVRTEPGRVVHLWEGRRLTTLVGPGGNHVFAGVNPPRMMDLSFALHVLCLVHRAGRPALPPGVHPVPDEVEDEVARLALRTMGLEEVARWASSR